MKTLLAIPFAVACTAAGAQTPANNPMPDGSRDLYLGLGVVSEPTYMGSDQRRVRALPLVQLEWSNGVFISGTSAGIHLSHQPSLEYGPLLALQARRTENGAGPGAGGVTPAIPGMIRPSSTTRAAGAGGALAGMDNIQARLQGGVFVNYYVTPKLRLTNSVLYGAGKWHDGLAWNLGLQHTAADITSHHRFTVGAGITMVNHSYNTSFYGVSPTESVSSGYPAYRPGSGVQDVYLGAGWNWALSPSWILASGARVTRLQGDARHSPLVQRPTNVSIFSGLAYRF
jgi:outer membrane protein